VWNRGEGGRGLSVSVSEGHLSFHRRRREENKSGLCNTPEIIWGYLKKETHPEVGAKGKKKKRVLSFVRRKRRVKKRIEGFP